MLVLEIKKMAIILPTGQWYAPSAVINDAGYCMVLHCIAWYCTILYGIAWYGMVLHGVAWYCMVLHGIALSCTILLHLSPSCTMLHHVARVSAVAVSLTVKYPFLRLP